MKKLHSGDVCIPFIRKVKLFFKVCMKNHLTLKKELRRSSMIANASLCSFLNNPGGVAYSLS